MREPSPPAGHDREARPHSRGGQRGWELPRTRPAVLRPAKGVTSPRPARAEPRPPEAEVFRREEAREVQLRSKERERIQLRQEEPKAVESRSKEAKGAEVRSEEAKGAELRPQAQEGAELRPQAQEGAELQSGVRERVELQSEAPRNPGFRTLMKRTLRRGPVKPRGKLARPERARWSVRRVGREPALAGLPARLLARASASRPLPQGQAALPDPGRTPADQAAVRVGPPPALQPLATGSRRSARESFRRRGPAGRRSRRWSSRLLRRLRRWAAS